MVNQIKENKDIYVKNAEEYSWKTQKENITQIIKKNSNKVIYRWCWNSGNSTFIRSSLWNCS